MGKRHKLLSRVEYELFLKSIPKNICTFCEYHDYQIVLKEGWRWVWIANLAPYWKYHTMLISKRHFTEYIEMDDFESVELKEMLNYAMGKYRNAELRRDDGTKIEKFVYFWRKRDNKLDRISGTIRPDHFHVHIAPDRDHLWDDVIDDHAYKVDIVKSLKI